MENKIQIMNIYTTIIKAIDPKDGILKTWSGQRVQGISFEDAQNYCDNNGLGFCKVDGILIAELNEDGTDYIDYEKPRLN